VDRALLQNSAASARCDAIRLVFDFVDEAKLLRTEAPNSRGQ
jgi:hypothetical protein